MRRFGFAPHIPFCVSLLGLVGICQAQQTAHSLPQALPGSAYAAQLTIPPGLGYPFARCELSGQTPRWLTIDCARLQLKGKVPSAASGDADYQVTLRIEDNAGNSRSFALALRVSAKPQVVSLGDPSEGAMPRDASSAEKRDKVDPAPAASGITAPKAAAYTARTAPAAEDVATTHDAAPGTGSRGSESGPSGEGTYAADLRMASAGLHRAPVAASKRPTRAPSKTPAEGSDATLQTAAATSTSVASPESLRGASLGKPIVQPIDEGATTISVDASEGAYLIFYNVPKLEPVCDPPGDSDTKKLSAEKKLAADKRNPCLTREKAAAVVPPGTREDGLSCLQAIKDPRALLMELKTSATNATRVTAFKTEAGQTQTVYLQQAVTAGSRICVLEAAKDAIPDLSKIDNYGLSNVVTVQDTLDWGRVRAYFVGGVLISNTDNSFASSSAHQFLDLNIDKFWLLPDCAIEVRKGECPLSLFQRRPGLSTYFDTRLTAIPVATSTTTTSKAGMGTPTTISIGSSLTSQQTAKVQVGAYLPVLISTWDHNQTENALYVGPIAKVGFDTLTGTTTPSSTVSGTTAATSMVTQTQQLDRVYNFYSYGARIGHFGLYPTKGKSPELQSYLDVTFGPYSNLESYICENSSKGFVPAAGTNTLCSATATNFRYKGELIALPNESLKRIYRLDLEGLLKIPATPLVIGFNANIGQKAIGADYLDTRRVPADDVRFLFGTKFDIATVMKKLGVGQ